MLDSSNNPVTGRKARIKKLKPKHSRRSVRELCSNPADLDVLCGRGRGFFDHPGNRRMLSIISKYKPDYQTAPKIEKSTITQQVLKIILNPEEGHQPRFLKRLGNGKDASWYELCEKEVHKKVAHTLREHKIIKVARSTINDDKQQFLIQEKLSTRRSIVVVEEERLIKRANLIPLPTDFDSTSRHLSQAKCSLPKTQEKKKNDRDIAATAQEKSSNILNSSTPFSISDDESLSHVNGESKSKEAVDISVTEPLDIQQEPLFNDGDLDALLYSAVHEVVGKDVPFGSLLGGEMDVYDRTRSNIVGRWYDSSRSSKIV